MKRAENTTRHLAALILLLAATLCACSARQAGEQRLSPAQVTQANRLLDKYGAPEPKNLDAMPELTPDILVMAYERDQQQADAQYGDQWLKVRGRLVYGPTNEGFQGMNMYYVGLEEQGKRMAFLFFGSKHEEALRVLRRGQTLRIAGMYTPGEKHLPKLIGCTLLSAE